jgi:ribosomal protein S18 acetylase RimI-like enzyme
VTGPGPTVRRAAAADLPWIGRLGARLLEEHYAFDSRRFLAPGQWTPADYASFIGAQLDDPDSTVLVAEDDGEVIGYAYAVVAGYDYMALRGPAGILHDLIVDPRYRGRRAGRLLVDAILADLGSRGVPRVVLSAAERNEPAQRFFASLGFRRTMIEMTREFPS